MTDVVETPGFAPLVTERLILRPFRTEDAAELHRLINDWEVCRNLAVVPFPYSRAEADAWVESTQTALAENHAWQLVIVGHEEGREMVVGGVGVRLDDTRRVGILGYWVGRRFWGHGVATEAARRLSRWALANLDIERLEADVATDNPGSAAVLRRIGFRHIGEATKDFRARGGTHKVLRFAATRADLFGEPQAEPTQSGEKPMLLVAACALVDLECRVLLARRPEGKKMAGLWEFPGGKLNADETPEAALIRELKEELGIDVASNCLAPFSFASHAYDNFHLLMPLFICRRWKGIPRAREGQTLAWVKADRLSEYPMPEADRPLVPLLRDFL
jgi:8-oxo-dGTP diphosphatase